MKTNKLSIIVLLLMVALLLPGPGYSANAPLSVVQLVANTKKEIKTVNMAEFKAMYDKKDVGLLIDVRDPDEYATGHIPGAVNISRGTLEFKIRKLVASPNNAGLNKKIMLYCASGGRSALATKSLMDMGFTNVTGVDIKLVDWEKAGYPFSDPEVN
jgi:rhodanese-related sulfurtransferase